MIKRSMLCTAVISVALIAGCSQPYRVASQSDQAEFAKQQQGGAGQTDATKRGGTETITERDMTSAQQAESQRMIRELQQKMQDVYFDYDSFSVREDARPVLKGVSAAIAKARGIKVVVEGHCDDRGTSEYNLGLGEKRAHAVKEYLIAIGTPSNRIETISYGKEKQICTSATEECWAKNRRAHFTLIEEGR